MTNRLLDYIPSVHHLTVRLFTDLQNCSKYAHIQNTHNIASNVRLLRISIINNLPFNQVEELVRHRFKRLERLTFEFKTDASSQSCLDYVDEQRWECLLDTLLSLEQFQCCLELPVDCEGTARTIFRSVEANDRFLQRRWKCSIETFTYSYSTNVRIHTRPYPKRRLVTTPSKASADQTKHLYAAVRDLHLLIDIIPRPILSHLSRIIYDNVTSLTLIANKSFDEPACLTYLSAMMNSERLQYLTIQLDNCSQGFLSGVLETFSKLHSLTLSTYGSWSKLIDLSATISRSSLRSLNVYELFADFDRYESIHQLCRQLEILSVSVGSINECYRFLTLLLVGHARKTVSKLRSLTIKCEFAEPDVIAQWLRANVLRRLSYRCTTSVLAIWL